MKRSLASLTIIAIFSAFVLTAHAKGDQGVNPSAVPIGSKAPAFTLKDTDGKDHSLSDYAGKIVVLEWVNPGCPFVQRHYRLKTMSKLASKYGPKDVVWLAINSTNTSNADENRKWRSDHALSYPILLDLDGKVGHAYGATNTPHMFVVDKNGKLAYAGGIDNQPTDHDDINSDTINYVDKALTELTGGQQVSVPQSKPYGCSVKYKD